jgi:hypothetical protein
MAFLFFAVSLSAQNFLNIISYSTALPVGHTSDFIDDFSWRGFSIEGRSFTQRNLSFGIMFGWNYFDQRTDETVQIPDGAVTGTQIHYLDVIPIMANVHYYFGKKRRKSMRAYMGLSAGTYIISQRMDIGIWAFRRSNWHFGVAPEVGVLVPLGSTSLALAVKYNYAFNAGETFFDANDNSHSYISFNIGFAFYY